MHKIQVPSLPIAGRVTPVWVTSACGESSGALAVAEKEQKELQLEGAAYQRDKKAFFVGDTS